MVFIQSTLVVTGKSSHKYLRSNIDLNEVMLVEVSSAFEIQTQLQSVI